MKLAALFVLRPVPLEKISVAALSNLNSGIMVRLSTLKFPESVVAKTFLPPLNKGDNFLSSK